METSNLGLRRIACFEAFVSVAYLDDSTGGVHYSMGFGSQTPPPKEGDTTTIQEALKHLRADLVARDRKIAQTLKVPVAQHVWDAIASLYYQRGTKALEAVCALYNAGHAHLAEMEFARWNSGQAGIPTEGHSKRRAQEIDMARHADYGDISAYLCFNGNPRLVTGVMTPFPDDIGNL